MSFAILPFSNRTDLLQCLRYQNYPCLSRRSAEPTPSSSVSPPPSASQLLSSSTCKLCAPVLHHRRPVLARAEPSPRLTALSSSFHHGRPELLLRSPSQAPQAALASTTLVPAFRTLTVSSSTSSSVDGALGHVFDSSSSRMVVSEWLSATGTSMSASGRPFRAATNAGDGGVRRGAPGLPPWGGTMLTLCPSRAARQLRSQFR